MSPDAATLTTGETVRYELKVIDAKGRTLTTRPAAWASSNTAVVRVADGVATAVAPGQAAIGVTVDGQTARATVTVVASGGGSATVASVSLLHPNPRIAVSGTAQTAIQLRDASGQGIAVGSRTITWTTSSGAIATVSNTGVVTGVASGTATITATVEGKSGSAPIVVYATTPSVTVASVVVSHTSPSIAVGATSQALVQLRDAQGQTVALGTRTVGWVTSNAATARVSSTGVVTGVAAGTATISATVDGKSGSAPITVAAAPGTGNTAGTCTSVIRMASPGPGGSTGWVQLGFPKGLDVRIDVVSLNTGSTAKPSYEHKVYWRNRYRERIYFSHGWSTIQAPQSSGETDNVAAGASAYGTFYYGPGTGSIWMYVSGVRFGDFFASKYCE